MAFTIFPPQGRRYTPWSQIYGTTSVGARMIRLFRADGGSIAFWVPKADHAWLAKVVEWLIRHH